MLPIAKSNSQFLYEQIRLTIDVVNQSSGIVKAVIYDGNRNNQAFLRLFDTEPQQPWLTKGAIYLLYDFVHLLKNITNNWLTEKMGELAFYERGMKKVARWSHLVELYKLEAEGVVKVSKLMEVSVYPKPIERQSVATSLRVCCEENYTAIINHRGMRNVDGREHTTAFIKIVVNCWKILNVKNKGVDVRFSNKLQAVLQDPLDERLNIILQSGKMALQMKGG